MGYRLEISKVVYSACGGKLFGYVDDEKKLKSHEYLLRKGYITGEEYWSYGCNPKIVLDSVEFIEFMKLYNEDMNVKCWNLLEDKEIKELLSTTDDKLLEWW